jgi:hypothetical protein
MQLMSTSSRIRLACLAVTALLAVVGPAAAHARALRTHASSYGVGTYSGKMSQVLPKTYSGPISFVVTRGQITGLSITMGVACQGLGWVRDVDPIPTLAVAVTPIGTFSYVGTIGGRHLRFSGILTGHKLVGWFFESFWLGHDFCTMDRPAPYTATG